MKNIKYILTLFILIIAVFLMYENIHKNTEETNNYEFVNGVSAIEENKIINFITKIDDCLLEVTPNCKNNEISQEQMIDYVLLYINQNYSMFAGNIKKADKNFIYTIEGTEYKSNEHIDKKSVLALINEFFGIQYIDFTSYKFYDKQSDSIAVLPIRGYNIDTKFFTIISINKDSDNSYIVDIEYKREVGDVKNVFSVKYYLNVNSDNTLENNIYLTNFVIYNSVKID